MKWLIEGTRFADGRDVQVEIEAKDETHARDIAAYMRVAVLKIRPRPEPEVSDGARFGKSVGAAVVGLAMILIFAGLVAEVDDSISDSKRRARADGSALPTYQGPVWERLGVGGKIGTGITIVDGRIDVARPTSDGVYVMWTMDVENFSGKGQSVFTVRPVYMGVDGRILRRGDELFAATAIAGRSPVAGDDLLPEPVFRELHSIEFEFKRGAW